MKHKIKWTNFGNIPTFLELIESDNRIFHAYHNMQEHEWMLANRCGCMLTKKYTTTNDNKRRVRDYTTTYKGRLFQIKIIESMNKEKVYSTWNCDYEDFGTIKAGELLDFLIFILKLNSVIPPKEILDFGVCKVATVYGYNVIFNPNGDRIDTIKEVNLS